MMTFFVYFYMGFAIKRGLMKVRMLRKGACFSLILLYLALMVLTLYMKETPVEGMFQKGLMALFLRLLHLVGAMSMVLAIFSLANNAWLQVRLKKNDFLITMSGYCYGVYIYQQFILKYLYYNTSMAHNVSAKVLPWIGLVVTLVLSLLFCHLTLKTRFGRYLIG